MTRHVDTFDSLGAFVTHATETPRAWGEGYYATKQGNAPWSGKATVEEAASLARYGWPEGRDAVEALSLSVDAPDLHAVAHETWSRDVAGAYPDVALAISGDPACMWDCQEVETPTRVLRVQVSMGANCSISADSLRTYGAALLSYIDALEHTGWRVELTTTLRTVRGDDTWTAQVRVKDAGQPIDIDRLAFAVAHPAMLRRLGFRWLESVRSARVARHGYGHSVSAPPDDFDVTFPALDHNLFTVAEGLAFIRQHTNLLTDAA